MRVVVRPAVKGVCQCGGLTAARRKVLLQHEHDRHVAFCGEVSDVPGDLSPALGMGSYRNLSIIGRLETSLKDVHRVVAILFPQQHGRSRREHLIEQERVHPSSASRWRAAARLALPWPDLRSPPR